MSLNSTLPAPTSHASIVGDIGFATLIPLAWMNYLPPAAAGLTCIWVALQIYSWFINKNWKVKVEFKQVTTTTVTGKSEEPKKDG